MYIFEYFCYFFLICSWVHIFIHIWPRRMVMFISSTNRSPRHGLKMFENLSCKSQAQALQIRQIDLDLHTFCRLRDFCGPFLMRDIHPVNQWARLIPWAHGWIILTYLALSLKNPPCYYQFSQWNCPKLEDPNIPHFWNPEHVVGQLYPINPIIMAASPMTITSFIYRNDPRIAG